MYAQTKNKVKKFIDPDICIGKELVVRGRLKGFSKVKEAVPQWHWIPSEFTIDLKSKRVKKISHIEHFEPQKDSHVYSAISAVFSDLWPMLERVLSINTIQETIVLPVIVKVQSCSMPPLAVYEGFWHQENVTKGIVAVGLYYYEYDSNLSKGQLDVRPAQVIYHAFSDEGKVYKFGEDDGHIPVQERTAIVFDNKEVVHKFARVTNNSMQMDSNRSFVSFFVLGFNSKIQTTKTIGCKCLEWHAKRLDIILQLNGIIPKPILCYICELAGFGESQDETKIGIDWIHSKCENTNQERRNEGWGAMDGGVMRFLN